MITRKLMEKPSPDVMKHFCSYYRTGKEFLSLISDKKFFSYNKEIPIEKIRPEGTYNVYEFYGRDANSPIVDAHTIFEYIEEIVEFSKEEQDKWEQVRNNAAISIMNSLLETTEHSVVLEPAANTIYARVAVAYADSLIKELYKKKDWIEKLLEI